MIEVVTLPVAFTRPVRRRWQRFSLRTLLLFTMLMASGTLLWMHRFPWRLERVWDSTFIGSPDGKPRGEIYNPRLLFTPDGRRIITFNRDACTETKVWEADSGKFCWSDEALITETDVRVDCIITHGGKWVCLSRTAPRSPLIFFGWENPCFFVRFLNLETGKPMELPESLIAEAKDDSAPHEGLDSPIDNPASSGLLLDRVAIAEDDALMAVVWKGGIHVFNPASRVETCVLKETKENARPVHFYSNNQCLVVDAGRPFPRTWNTWDLAKAQLIQSVTSDQFGIGGWIESATTEERLYPQVAPWTSDGQTRSNVGPQIKSTASGTLLYIVGPIGVAEVIQPLDELGGVITSAIAPDDSRIATLDKDGTVRVWLKHRPIGALGLVWLPEFWLTVAVLLGVIWSKWRDSRAPM